MIAARIRRGFSLVELMIAIVLLGLGMIFVATIFPVAWTQARQMTEITTMASVTKGADTTLRMLARVDGYQISGSAFAGDRVKLRDFEFGLAGPPINQGDITDADGFVHALNLENILVNPRGLVDEQPWDESRLDKIRFTHTPMDVANWDFAFVDEKLFATRQVRLEWRLHPPIRPRKTYDFTQPDPEWDELLNSRRYVWAILHRLRNSESINLQAASDPTANPRRDFDVFYVMLRRPQLTNRYAQQDTNPLKVPDPNAPTEVAVPAPKPPSQDVMFPVPWRVHIFFTNAIPAVPRNLPSEVAVNFAPQAATHPMLVGMFPPGAYFIDEDSGLILRVEKRRIIDDGPNGEYAFLTLDREVLEQDLVGYQSQLRIVWVFPPPVQPRGGDNAPLIFEGTHPVVGIERRSLSISPPG